MPDDAELLRRYAVEKSEPAFAELVGRHLDLVYSAALRQVGGDAHRAHDVAQIVFATLARKAAALGRHPVLAGWLYNTTRHVAQRAMRAEQRRRIREAEACRMSEHERGESAVEWERIRPVLDDAMKELGERDREAVVLRFFARRPFAEVGRALGLSEDAARMRVERALEKLRVRLARRGVASAAGLSAVLANQAVVAAPAGMAAGVSASAVATTSAVALGPVVAAVEFMSTTKIFLGGVTLVVALTLATAVHEAQASRAAYAALAQAQGDLKAMHGRLGEGERRAASAEQETIRLKAEADALRARQTAEQARNRPAQPLAMDTSEGDALIARHPELKRIIVEGRRAQAAGSYAALFKQLQLTPAQIERFKDLANQGGTSSFTGRDGELIRYGMNGDRRQAEIELHELLGEEGFQLYKNYYDGPGLALYTTTQLAGDLFHTPQPLTAQQAEQLQRILVEERHPMEWSNRPQYDWPAIMVRARDVLQPEQLAALGDVGAHDKFSQALTQARMRGEVK